MQAQRLFLRSRSCLRRLTGGNRALVQPAHVRYLSAAADAGAAAASSNSPSDPIPPPPLDGKPRQYPEKLTRIVDEISQLTLLETSQLNDLLKTTLNIPDAPVMTMGAMPTTAAKAEVDESPVETQTAFTVKLVKYADDSKIKLIKEVKAQTEGMNLVQAKKFVESLPQEVKGGVSREEADKLAAALEAVGGVVEIV